MKKKIGIFTFHYAHNYGAVLQAYALRETVRELGCEAHIINYRNEHVNSSYVYPLPKPAQKYSIRHPRAWKIVRDKRLDIKIAQKDWKNRCEIFSDYILRVLQEGCTDEVKREDIGKLGLDIMICGSDQIWTEYLTDGMDKVYFGEVEGPSRIITYAASRYCADIPMEQKDLYRKSLDHFQAISVREEELAQSISEITGRKIETVVDPTLLIEKDKYTEIERDITVKGPYCLAYYLTESDSLRRVAEAAADELGCQLIEIHYYRQRGKRKGIQICDCDPGQFLRYIANAELVITNSFHGTVFSIIYEKKFWSVYGEDSRKQGILELAGLQNRHIEDTNQMDNSKEIDYKEVNKRIKEARDCSIRFLNENL